jgi:hypothetical protein
MCGTAAGCVAAGILAFLAMEDANAATASVAAKV